MAWYHLFEPIVEKWLVILLFTGCFSLILYRGIPIHYLSLAAALLLMVLGITNPASALLQMVDWDVLAIYWGYGMLAMVFRESRVPSLIASYVLARVKKEKYALLFICSLAAFLSAFMANPVIVIMLAPLAIEIAERLKASLFIYLVALAISSNVVTTVTMVADPPALILAMATGMNFLDFYWFKGNLGLGTLSVVGVVAALLTLLFYFRDLNNTVTMAEEKVAVTYGPVAVFVLSVLALAFIPMKHPGTVGLGVGLASL
ncbi:MAG: SLC13 family permease, partial [Deltaproteobacteria bacterium]|nr:SLC13 family permease [Deltaproteobacteria bacterium]